MRFLTAMPRAWVVFQASEPASSANLRPSCVNVGFGVHSYFGASRTMDGANEADLTQKSVPAVLLSLAALSNSHYM